MTPLTSVITLDMANSADQEYVRHKLEDDVYLAIDGFSLEELAKMRGWPKEIVDWVAEELTIKVTT